MGWEVDNVRESRPGSTNSLSGSNMEVCDQLHAPRALPSAE